MKRFLIVIALLCLAGSLQAATITLAVDSNATWPAGTTIRFYEKAGTVYTLMTEVTTPTVQGTFTVVPGVHSYVARAYSVWESADSNVVSTPAVPAAPGNLRMIAIVLAGIGAVGLLIWALVKKIF